MGLRFGDLWGLLLSVRRFGILAVRRVGRWRYLPIFLLVVVGAVFPFLMGTLQVSRSIPSGGLIKAINVSVFGDENCSVPLSSIDWGVLEPGSSVNRTIWVRNDGNYGLTLSLSTGNWSPVNASDYLVLGWDYGGEVIGPGEVLGVVLTLSVSPDIVGVESFSFEIVIVGSG